MERVEWEGIQRAGVLWAVNVDDYTGRVEWEHLFQGPSWTWDYRGPAHALQSYRVTG